MQAASRIAALCHKSALTPMCKRRILATAARYRPAIQNRSTTGTSHAAGRPVCSHARVMHAFCSVITQLYHKLAR